MTPQHSSGSAAVQAFCDLDWAMIGAVANPATSSSGSKSTSDAIVFIASIGLSIPVEVKGGTSGISQVRPLAFTTLVIERPDVWYVFSASTVLVLAASYSGQHSKNPLAAFNPGVPPKYWSSFKHGNHEVPFAVLAAHSQAQSSPLKATAHQISREIELLHKLHRLEVVALSRAKGVA